MGLTQTQQVLKHEMRSNIRRSFRYKVNVLHKFCFHFLYKQRSRNVQWLSFRHVLSVRRKCPVLSSRPLLSRWRGWRHSAMPTWNLQPSAGSQWGGAVPRLSSRWEHCFMVFSLKAIWILLENCGAKMSFHLLNCNWATVWFETDWYKFKAIIWGLIMFN